MYSFRPPQVDLLSLAPVIIVAITGGLGLILEMINPRKSNRLIAKVSGVGLVVAMVATFLGLDGSEASTFGGMALRDGFGSIITLILLLIAFLSLLFSEAYMEEKKIPFGEFYPLMLWATGGAIIMSTSMSLLMIFIGLETLSIALYVLCGLSRSEVKSEESAIKYFLLGAFASAFLLYGIAFFYGATSSLSLSVLRSDTSPVSATIHFSSIQSIMMVLGLGMILVGLCFKTALVPFHQWAPDVYQGAPTNVTAFMSAASKVAALAVLTRVLVASRDLEAIWFPALFWIAIMTMIVGNVVALVQTDTKRILAYSSIAHSGYVLVAILAIASGKVVADYTPILYYLLSYSIMTVGAFAAISLMARGGTESTSVDRLNGLWKRNPTAAVSLLVLMLSLVGLPPFSGFIGKVLIFQQAVNAGLLPLAIVLALCSIVSASYYLKIAFAAFASEPSGDQEPFIARPSTSTQIAYIASAIGVILISIFYSPITSYFTR